MFRIVAWLSRRARTMPRRSPLTRVIPALCIATSVPLPMAIPTSAWARAGASFTPSPAIATTSLGVQALDEGDLLIRQHLRLDVGDGESPRDGERGRPAVAGHHHDANTSRPQHL